MTKIDIIINSLASFLGRYMNENNWNTSNYEIYNAWIHKSDIKIKDTDDIKFALKFIADQKRKKQSRKGVTRE